MLGITLLYVGGVLFVNGLWLLGKMEDRAAGLLNGFVGILTFMTALYPAFAHPDDPGSFYATAQGLLFSFTYLWVFINNMFRVEDGRGLGWYCLFVVLVAVPTAMLTFLGGDVLFGLIWLAWAVLWFIYFLLLALRKNIQKTAAYFTLFCAFFTALFPGFLMLTGRL